MAKELYALRLEPKMKREIMLISKVLHVSESEWLRNKIAYDIKETLDTLRTQIALEYAKGTVTETELREVFGDKTTQLIAFVFKKVKSDFEKAYKLPEKISPRKG